MHCDIMHVTACEAVSSHSLRLRYGYLLFANHFMEVDTYNSKRFRTAEMTFMLFILLS